MSDIQRYDLHVVNRYAGDGSGEIETDASIRPKTKGRYISFDDHQSELSTLREGLETANGCLEEWRRSSLSRTFLENANLQQRLTAAEQRNAAIVGKVTKCKECGSDDLFWFAQNTVSNGIQQNRLSTHDVKCVFVLGCNNCSETLKLLSADKIAEQMTATLKPTESGTSEPQCLLCLDAKTVPGNIPGGLVKDCPDCCGEEG